jgi:hypothetical protein
MSDAEERAALLRAIASGGFDPWRDSDGSTANTLLEMAEELAPVLGATVPKAGTGRRRFYLRLRVRAKVWLLNRWRRMTGRTP